MSDDRDAAGRLASRRGLLKAAAGLGAAAVGGAVIAGVAGSGVSGHAVEGPAAVGRAVRRLRMVTTWPKNFPGLGTGVERFARRVEEASGGSILIRVYAAGELVPALSAFDAVAQGKADMYHGGEYYWQGKHPAFSFFSAVPMGLIASENHAWMYYGGGQELWDRLSARFNIKAMPCGNTGTQMGGWFRRPVETLEDFRGLRIRMPGLGGEVMQRLGATPVTKAGGEVFQALDQGNIDATEWVGPWNDMAFGLHTIAKNYYYPGIHEPGSILSLGINLGLWESLSVRERALIGNAAQAETVMMYSEFEHNNGLAVERLLREGEVSLRRFSDAILERMAEIGEQVLQDVAAADPFTGEVYESFKAARRRGQRWGDISERAYIRARARAIG